MATTRNGQNQIRSPPNRVWVMRGWTNRHQLQGANIYDANPIYPLGMGGRHGQEVLIKIDPPKHSINNSNAVMEDK